MSPKKRDAGADYQAGPVVVTYGSNKTDNHHLEEKSAASVRAMDQMLAMLGDLSDRMNRMEFARTEQASKDQKGSPESIFGSVLGVGAGMSL
uniref:Uncharacterized protein n=1 Tax=Peronospora matthiolae TaxID=2874970 RepID=A0AAV1U801_9STRA